VAEKTGWTMDYILWRLPIAAGFQLCDAWASRNGCKLAWSEIDMGELE
jgi:hypothetical protein